MERIGLPSAERLMLNASYILIYDGLFARRGVDKHDFCSILFSVFSLKTRNF